MYATQRATQLAKTITMACSVQKQPTQPQHTSASATVTAAAAIPPTMTVAVMASANNSNNSNTNNIASQVGGGGSNSGSNSSMSGGGGVGILTAALSDATSKPLTPKPRGSLPNDANQPPQVAFQWPPIPVSTHTSNLRLNMMNQNPKDLHTARLMIEELRTKVRYQAEHIMKWRKAYALQVRLSVHILILTHNDINEMYSFIPQIQQHYRYQKEKSDQMNTLTSQLLLLESRLKRKQKQIASLLSHREITIHRQQKIIDTLSNRLSDHGLDAIEANFTTELDSLNDSDSAVVLEDIDSDSSNMPFGARRRSSGGGSGGGMGFNATQCGSDGITIVRSISDAIETNLNKYSGVRRNNCFLRRPEILETVYSVEEDPEPTTDVAEKRDKFRNRSEKALSSSSTEGQIDSNSSHAPPHASAHTTLHQTNNGTEVERTKENIRITPPSPQRQLSVSKPLESSTKDGYTAYSVMVPQLRTTAATPTAERVNALAGADVDGSSPGVKSQVTNYNRVMSNHRSVTKPKDVKYKRINKAKSKSLEELRGRLKNLVERGGSTGNGLDAPGTGGVGGPHYTHGVMPQTAQSYA